MRLATLALLGLLLFGCQYYGAYGDRPTSTTPCDAGIVWAHRCVWVASVDTMKLSKDREDTTYSDAQIAQVVNLIAATNATHITVDTHYDRPGVQSQWVRAIRAAGKHVWFRGGVRGWGNGTITPTQWLASYRTWLDAHTDLIEAGDILDANAETENGFYAYCHCDLYTGSNVAAQRAEFNRFLRDQVAASDQVLAAHGFAQGRTNDQRDVLTTVHSVDPGSALNVLEQATVDDAGGLVTSDAYPDQSTADPATAASKWSGELAKYHSKWPNAKILLGEMGYRVGGTNPSDSVQRDVLAAEMHVFHDTTMPLVGMNYWVGPGWSGAGDFTYIMCCSIGSFAARPGAACVAALFDQRNGGTTPLC